MPEESLYQRCLPILQDAELDDDDRTERLEDFVRKESSKSGKDLENTVLDILWKFRAANSTETSGAIRPSSRITVIRKASPATWQQITRSPTPSQSLPKTLNSTLSPSPSFLRSRSTAASPFASPRASPRLAFAAPYIPHSPRLDAYQFNTTDPSPTEEEVVYGDMGNDSVEWLVGGDDVMSNASSIPGDHSANGELVHAQMVMDPYDILRSIFGDELSNDALEKALDDNGYDIAATMNALMESYGFVDRNAGTQPDLSRTVLIGKSMSPSVRPSTPVGQQKSPIVCRYWLATGHCARADCKFSHDTSSTVCKYWLQGSCLAGTSCAFSHDPTGSFARIMQEGTQTPPGQTVQPNFHDFDAFPTLQAPVMSNLTSQLSTEIGTPQDQNQSTPQATVSVLNPLATFTPSSVSRPASRQASRAPTPSIPAVDDNDAFPTLGSATAKHKRHHGKRGHGHAHKESPSSLADVIRMAQSPSPSQSRSRASRSRLGSNRELNASALAIPPPENLPWLSTGDSVNKAYVKARTEAFKHASQRNKLLQGAAQAYNRQDARSAKALSLRGQAENTLMREAHRKAADILYEDANKGSSQSKEIFIDLHGLHAEEAVEYLNKALRAHETESPMRPVYAITGTGHHSRGGKDKIGKSVKAYLNEWHYIFREFSVPGDRNGMGGIIGIDPTSWDRSISRSVDSGVKLQDSHGPPLPGQSTRLLILRKED